MNKFSRKIKETLSHTHTHKYQTPYIPLKPLSHPPCFCMMSMSNKIHSQGNIPFSWENKPGVSKAARHDHHHLAPLKLPPPPCPSGNTRISSVHDLQIPLPPCPFLPPLRSSSRKGLKKMNDPFLMAYKEVTKSTTKGKSLLGGNKGDQGLGVMKNMSICKQSSCSVKENSVVRLSQLPISRSYRDGAHN